MRIEAASISFSYGKRRILDDISFSADSGSMTALLGRNGSGKTTLLRILLGFLQPGKGQVSIDGTSILRMKERERAQRIAYIPQATVPVYPYRALDTVLMGRSPALSLFERPGADDERKAARALERLGIGHLGNRTVDTLSGGERQLVMIARALAQEAGILLLDEPTSSLDYSNQLLVMETLTALRDDGYTILFSTHSPEQALMDSTAVIILSGGKAAFHGSAEELMDGRILSDLYSRQLFITRVDTGKSGRIVCIPE